MYDARDITKDIDALYSPKNEFRNIISNIGEKYKLPEDWLNDSAKVFFTNKMKTEVFKKYSNLVVKCFDSESLLALKLTSGRKLYSHDLEDSLTLIKYLDIKNIDKLHEIVEKYIPSIRLTPKVDYFIQEVWQKYNKEKESEKNE